MLVRNVAEGLFSRAGVKVTRALLLSNKRELTTTDVGRLAGVSLAKTVIIMNNLERLGVVRSHSVGRAIVWRLNAQSYILNKILRPPIEGEAGFLTALKDELKKLAPYCDGLILYGSIIDGKEEVNDIDILVLINMREIFSRISMERLNKQLDDVRYRLLERFNIVLSPIILSAKQLKLRKDQPFAKAALQKGEWLSGKKEDLVL